MVMRRALCLGSDGNTQKHRQNICRNTLSSALRSRGPWTRLEAAGSGRFCSVAPLSLLHLVIATPDSAASEEGAELPERLEPDPEANCSFPDTPPCPSLALRPSDRPRSFHKGVCISTLGQLKQGVFNFFPPHRFLVRGRLPNLMV